MSDILDDMFLPGTGGHAPTGGFLPTPELTRLTHPLTRSEQTYDFPPMTKATPESDILNDMFIDGTGGFAPSGGLLPEPIKTRRNIEPNLLI